MIPKLEITLLAAGDKSALFNVGIQSLNKEESHVFSVTADENDEISGKKKMMEFVSEIMDEFAEEFRKETKES